MRFLGVDMDIYFYHPGKSSHNLEIQSSGRMLGNLSQKYTAHTFLVM